MVVEKRERRNAYIPLHMIEVLMHTRNSGDCSSTCPLNALKDQLTLCQYALIKTWQCRQNVTFVFTCPNTHAYCSTVHTQVQYCTVIGCNRGHGPVS